MAGGKIKPPDIVANIIAVVANGKPGVLLAIQIEAFGKMGPRNNPDMARAIVE